MKKPTWKEERRKGIGGSDAAAILGLSPWKSAMDVWLDKMGMAEESADPNRQFLLDLGNDLEPVIAKLYERETKRSLYTPMMQRIVHPTEKFLAGTPDRLVKGELRGVELKSENQFMDEFGDPGTDEVPYHYLIQCAHYMAVTRFPVWDVALLHGGAAFSIYTIERDLGLERDMIDQLRAWWDEHIIGQKPPEVDGSSAWKVYLRKKFPADILPVKDVDEETLVLVNRLRAIRRANEQLSGVEAQIETRLKLVIGEHEGIQGEFGKITWKRSKDRNQVDWEKAFSELAVEAPNTLINEVLKRSVTSRPGFRRFLFKENEEWAYGNDGTGQTAIAQGTTGTDRALPGDGEHGACGAGQGADRSALRDGRTPSARS